MDVRSKVNDAGQNAAAAERMRIIQVIRSGSVATRAAAMKPSQVQMIAVSSRKLRLAGRRGLTTKTASPKNRLQTSAAMANPWVAFIGWD